MNSASPFRDQWFSSLLTFAALALLLGLLASCGEATIDGGADTGNLVEDGGGAADAGNLVEDGGAGADAGRDAGVGDGGVDSGPTDGGAEDAGYCPRTLGAVNRVRKVVVSHPYFPDGGQAPDYEVLELSTAGEVQSTGQTFQMRRAAWQQIAFTPDGEVGLVAQDDGTVGVFRFGSTGAVTVVQEAFQVQAGNPLEDVWISTVQVDPAGDRAWLVASSWREYGGGVYVARIGCDGALSDARPFAAAKMPYALLFMPDDPGRAVVYARDVLASPSDREVHLLSWGAAPALVASGAAFGDQEAIVSSAAVTTDGRWALFTDNSGYSGLPGRLAAVEVLQAGFGAAQVVSPFEDPAVVVVSPFGNAAIVVSGMGNAIHRLTYDSSNASAPFGSPVPLSYVGAAPQLPLVAIPIPRGSLKGRVLVAENTGIRQVQFAADGSVTDLGLGYERTGMADVTGALGVQP